MNCGIVYVKICEKAREIQALRNTYESWQDGDYYVDPSDKVIHEDLYCQGCIDERWTGNQYRLFKGKAIWLPRQDQLQEMVSKDWMKVLAILSAYAKNYDFTQCESMEQFSLAVVMKEKFKKIWSGTDWIEA